MKHCITCGNIIGKNAMIAAGSVVTKDVEDNALVQGVPAVQVGWVCECGEILHKSKMCLKCKKNVIEFI